MILYYNMIPSLPFFRCVDNGKQKCFQYWPSQGGTLDLKYLRISNSNESMHEDYVTRDFVIHDRNVSFFQFILISFQFVFFNFKIPHLII